MPHYQWTCHVCGASNEPTADACAKCAFPAIATGGQIYRARSLGAGDVGRQPPELDRYRTFWPRFLAGWIDFFVLWPLFWLDDLIWKTVSATVLLVPWFMVNSFAGVGYTILLHGYYGQTIGKRVMRVKVFDFSGAKLSMRQAVLRDCVILGLIAYTTLTDLPTVLTGANPNIAGISDMSLSWLLVSYAMAAWFSLEIITMLLNEKRRALHDFIAGSVVMRVSRARASSK